VAVANREFHTTRWSVIAAAASSGQSSDSLAREALENLCNIYWYPLYAYIRRRGNDHQAAEDLTQGFFAQLLQRDLIAKADPNRGRFRHFLLAALKNYLINDHAHRTAARRGGTRAAVPIDSASADARYGQDATTETPERLFDRRWALSTLESALGRVRAEYAKSGREQHFERLKQYLNFELEPENHASVAADLQLTIPATKTAIYRLRRRYQAALRSVIADSVLSAEEIDDEIRDLFNAVRG